MGCFPFLSQQQATSRPVCQRSTRSIQSVRPGTQPSTRMTRSSTRAAEAQAAQEPVQAHEEVQAREEDTSDPSQWFYPEEQEELSQSFSFYQSDRTELSSIEVEQCEDYVAAEIGEAEYRHSLSTDNLEAELADGLCDEYVTYTVSNKNASLANYNGYEFRQSSKHKGNVYWKCTNTTPVCKARIITSESGCILNASKCVHNEHLPDPGKAAGRNANSELKRKAEITRNQTTDELVSEVRTATHPAARAHMATTESMKRSVRRARGFDYREPQNLESLELPEEFYSYMTRAPIFPHNTWNMYSRLMDRRPRTNNQVEGFHNALASFFGVCHPNIFKFVTVIKGYAEKVDEDIDDILAQRKGRNFSKVWRQTEEAKRSIADLYDSNMKLRYLKAMSHHTSL